MTIRYRLTRGATLALLASVALAGTVRAAETPSDDPAAQAALYSKQAADLRPNAQMHADRARVHGSMIGPPKVSPNPHQSIARHCARLAEKLRAAAAGSEAVSKAYADLAKQP